jgi:hypothetical protein
MDHGLEGIQVNIHVPDQPPGTTPPSLHDGSSEKADHSVRNIYNSLPGILAAEKQRPQFYLSFYKDILCCYRVIFNE